MVSIQNAAQDIVTFNLREANLNDSMIINTELNFMEWFEKEISDERVVELQKQFPKLSIDNTGIEVRINASFLFINRCGYYSCFYNIGEHNPQWRNESEWNFSTNHDTCWRDNAFSKFNSIVFEVKDSILTLNEIEKVQNIMIPKHVIPNFSNIRTNEIFQLKEIDTDENYKKVKHILTSSKDEISLIVAD